VHCEQLQPAWNDGSILLIGRAIETYVYEGMRIRNPPDNLGNLRWSGCRKPLAHVVSEAVAICRQTASFRLLSHWPLTSEKAAKHMLIASVKRASTLIKKKATAHGIFDKSISKTSLEILAIPLPLYISQATYYNLKKTKIRTTFFLITFIGMNCTARLSRPYSKTQPTWKLLCKFGIIKEQITSFFKIIFALR